MSDIETKGEAESDEPSVVQEEESTRARRPRSRKLRHREHGTLVATGPSGTVYRFRGHGATLKVKGEDVDALLALSRAQRSCCGAAAVQRQQLLVEVSS